MIHQMKKDLQMGRWLQMPRTSRQYKFYRNLAVGYEVPCYSKLGMIASIDIEARRNTDSSSNDAIKYFKKAKVITKLFGDEVHSKHMEQNIATCKAKLAKSEVTNVDILPETTVLVYKIFNYNNCVKLYGLMDVMTIHAGVDYATALLNAHYVIEARG